MDKIEPGDNNPITQENEGVVNSNPLKGYAWKDGEEILLKDGSKLVLIKQGKNNFGFSYIDTDGTYHPELSQESGLSGPDDKKSPFIIFGNTIMEAGEEIIEENTESKSEEKKEKVDEIVTPKKIEITTAVRKIATEKGLTEKDLEKITGTGKGENITKKDIEKYLSSKEDDSKKEEWKEYEKEDTVLVLEKAKFSIKIGSRFNLGEEHYVVTSIKERAVEGGEIEVNILLDFSKNNSETKTIEMDLGELELKAEEFFVSLNEDVKKFKEALYGAPKIVPKEKKRKANKKITSPEAPENLTKNETEKSIEFNGFVFEAGKTTFKVDGNILRIEKIEKKGPNKKDWILTISKINPINKRVLEQKQKDGKWLSEIINDFASKNELNLKNTEDKNEAMEIAIKDRKREGKEILVKKIEKNSTKEAKIEVAPTTEKEASELMSFFANNLSNNLIKKPEQKTNERTEKQIGENKTKVENNSVNKIPENKEAVPNRSYAEKETVTTIKKEPEESGLKKIIQRENSKYKSNHENSINTAKKEKKANKWRNIKAWALGLLGLGVTAYGVKEYSEKETIDKELNLEPRYEYVESKKEQPQIKKEGEKKKVENKKAVAEELENQNIKNKELENTEGIETFKVKEIVRDSILENKNDSLKNIIPEKAPSFLVDAISMYHPELTNTEKEIIGTSYSKVLEYISGDDDIESFYKNISWLNTMGWEIDSTLEVSRKVLDGEYGEVGETEKRMAEYFINFAKRQEEKGLPANGVKTEEYIISGLIKDAGIKKE